MEGGGAYVKKTGNPYDKASFMSFLFFWWTYSVIKQGRQSPYEVDSIPEPARNDHAHILGNRLEQAWFEEVKTSKQEKKPSLLRVLIKLFWKEFMCIAIIHSINDLGIAIWKQILVGSFLVYLRRSTRGDQDALEMLKYVGVMLVFTFALNALLQNHFLSRSIHLGGRLKIALTSVVYRKCLRLKSCSPEDTSAGRIVNLLANDLRQFDMIICYCNYIWSGLLATAIILLVIVNYFGTYPVLACLISVLCSMPIQVIVSKTLAKNRAETAYASDKRIQATDEVIGGIQIIKMYAWEKAFESLILAYRKTEMLLVRKNIYLRGFQVGINLFVSKFSMYILIVMYALMGGDIVPEKVFLMAGYCSIFARVLCGMCFRSFGECGQCYVSVKRLQNFLELNEFEKPPLVPKKTVGELNMIELVGVSANWSIDSTRETLKDISLIIESGSLTTIIGEVGSGKSSFLNLIIGELPIHEGKFTIHGSISYYCQSPWIFAGTIRQNILFTEDFEWSRYERVIEACALKRDFEILPDGDMTLVGERGLTLSGGQKARISLARTVYKRADIYLLDDPLSAVDTMVSKKIFDECIVEFLKDKTRILVTHQSQFIITSDVVVLLQEGKFVTKGSFNEIMESDAEFIDTLKALNLKRGSVVVDESTVQKYSKRAGRRSTTPPTVTSEKKELEKEGTDKERKHALFRYLSSGAGVTGITSVITFCILAQVVFAGFDVWLQQWTAYTDECKKNMTRCENNTKQIFSYELTPTNYFITIYSVLLGLILVLIVVRNCTFAYYGQYCAKKIHKRSFHSVLYTNMDFFHKNPAGRILNRFSKDLGTADLPLVTNSMDAITSLLQVFAAFIVSAAVSIWFVPPALVASLSLFFVRKYYLKTSKNLKRVESVAKSPVFVHLHSTLQGLPIIRSSSAAAKMVEEFDQYQDVHTSAWFLYNYVSFGYSFALDFIGIVYLAIIVIGSMHLDLGGSMVGLCLAQVVILLNFTQWAMKQTAEVANDVTSIDRLMKYKSLPPEAQPTTDHGKPEGEWPSKGAITFRNVSLKYDSEVLPSIYDLTFTIEPREKIGVVGRTGAGKSSLLAALFRLGFVEGSIEIDNVDTSRVRLPTLRSKISVIPQDPVLFSGSIRKNLDPFGEFDDDALWNALEEAELKKALSDEVGPSGLNMVVCENGKNFSAGQRQLICLARAILRNNKILVLDEATANVDQQTDNIIQRTIRKKFHSCTVLTIAHRLNTVVDSDRILVMDGGRVVEFDHPYILLSNSHSYFSKLVAETGDFVAANLTSIAKDNYDNRNIESLHMTEEKTI